MAYFRHICNDADLDAALERISVLMDAKPGEHEYDELIVLTNLVEVYEDKHYRIGPAGFIDAIEFSMEQRGLTQDDPGSADWQPTEGGGSAGGQARHYYFDG